MTTELNVQIKNMKIKMSNFEKDKKEFNKQKINFIKKGNLQVKRSSTDLSSLVTKDDFLEVKISLKEFAKYDLHLDHSKK